jgi:hypothetical protein
LVSVSISHNLRKKEEGRRKKEEGRRMREEGRRKKEKEVFIYLSR